MAISHNLRSMMVIINLAVLALMFIAADTVSRDSVLPLFCVQIPRVNG